MQQPPPVPQLLSALDSFAGELAHFLNGKTIDWQRRPTAGDWNLTQVICHLRDVEREVHQERIRVLIAQDNPFLSGVSADNWAETRQYHLQDGPAALVEFLAARRETIELLAGMDMLLWQRQARHAFFGFTTMQELVYLVVKHDAAHLEQVRELLGEGGNA